MASELANPGYLKFQIVNEQIMRFLGRRQPPDVTGFTISGFWLFLGIWLMPWTFILPSALYRFWQETRPGREVTPRARLLFIWAAAILVFATEGTVVWAMIQFVTICSFCTNFPQT